MLITSGGVSVGDADFIGATIARLGQLAFWRTQPEARQATGLRIYRRLLGFGLPGNPVSTIVTCLLLVKPSLQILCGTRPSALLRIDAEMATQISHRPGRVEYQRGVYKQSDESGAIEVRHTGDQGSNRLSTFNGANCLIEIPKKAPIYPLAAA